MIRWTSAVVDLPTRNVCKSLNKLSALYLYVTLTMKTVSTTENANSANATKPCKIHRTIGERLMVAIRDAID